MNPKSNRLDLESSMRTTGMSGAAGECRVVNIKSALDADTRSARRARCARAAVETDPMTRNRPFDRMLVSPR